jgi:hypothetical protein
MTQTPPRPPYPQSSTAGTSQTTPGTVDQAQDKIGEVAGQAQAAAGEMADQAKQQATSQLEAQKGRAVDSLVSVAHALRQTSQHLHEQQQDPVGGYVEQAAERVERVTNYLRTRDVPQLVAETQDFARRQPGLFVAGAVALGFLGARFLISSGHRAAAQRPPALPAPYSSSYGQSGSFESSPRGASAGSARAMSEAPGHAPVPTPNRERANPAPGTTSALEA